MTNNNWLPPIRLFSQQETAWNYIQDDITREVWYGWGAWWWKSVLGSLWLATEIATKPWSTRAIGRSELKKIKLSTLITFKQILKDVWFSEDSYKYDDIKSQLTFKNWCRVVLIDLAENPSDPEFDRLWSSEYTWAFIDEAQEISDKAKQILSSRLRNLTGKQYFYSKSKEECEEWIKKNKKWVINEIPKLWEHQVVQWVQKIPKMLMTCNPWRNFIYTDFYKLREKKDLPPHRAFVQSLPTSNPFLPEAYIENLKNLDEVSKQLYGNFHYTDDQAYLFTIDTVDEFFQREKTPTDWTFYLTVDAARQWKDITIITLWENCHITDIQIIKKATLTTQAQIIQPIIDKYYIPISNVIVDEVWVGGWLVDLLGCKWFIGNQSAINPYESKILHYKKRNYQNLKVQSFFYLQRYLPKISIYPNCPYKEQLKEELLFIKQKDLDTDGKIQLESKKDMKAALGRSPDYADAMSFRMYYFIKAHSEWIVDKELAPDKSQAEIDDENLLKFLESPDDTWNPDSEENNEQDDLLDIYD